MRAAPTHCTAPADRCMSATSATAIPRSKRSSRPPSRRNARGATTTSTARRRKASDPIRCSRRTAGATTPPAPICRLRPRPIWRSSPTARRGKSCSRDAERSASLIGAEPRRNGSMRGARSSSPAAPSARRNCSWSPASDRPNTFGASASRSWSTRPRSAPICRTIATMSPTCAPRGRACSASRCRC